LAKTLKSYLDNKADEYKEFDKERFPNFFNSIKKNYKKAPFTIHVVGTNGKGSVGRFLALYLTNFSNSVAHFSSPHLFEVNERFWLNGKNVSDERLDSAFEALKKRVDKDKLDRLSYFEVLTLIANELFYECEYLVLEAGLGSEFDSTTSLKRDMTLITPIGLDHQEFLGDDIRSISTTKFQKLGKRVLYHPSLNELSKKLLFDEAKRQNVKLIHPLKLKSSFFEGLNQPKYLQENLTLSLSCAKEMGFETKKELVKELDLAGRFQKYKENVIIDVGHNELSASAIKEELKKSNKKVILVYNSLKEKDYKKIIEILKPVILGVEVIEIETNRAMNKDELIAYLKEKKLYLREFEKANDDKEYLVFGSFFTALAFLKRAHER
jgi:dihydrofolate synthase/folylpolyglutamate synthase